ncbi:MAG: fibronectin type III domain-containing protein [Bacteroidetes bacterium]|nr:fibronectin type III domain-containing protein [Bacteroidota bacterium]
MKTVKKHSKKMSRVHNQNRVNRNRNKVRRAQLLANPLMMLVTITFAFQELSTPEKVLARIRMHIMKLTGNAYFPSVDPTLADLLLKADQLEALISAAASGDHDLILQRDEVIREILAMITLLGYDIQKQSGGDRIKIESAGFKTRKVAGTTQPCTKVVIKTVESLETIEILLEWGKVKGAKVYWIEIKTEPTGKWKVIDLAGVLNYKLNGYLMDDEFILIQPGLRYFFRIRAWNNLGFGEYSEIVDAICID